MPIKTIEGQLEIDAERGVIYFHNNETGGSSLRICGLPKPIPTDLPFGKMLDITITRDRKMFFSWVEK